MMVETGINSEWCTEHPDLEYILIYDINKSKSWMRIYIYLRIKGLCFESLKYRRRKQQRISSSNNDDSSIININEMGKELTGRGIMLCPRGPDKPTRHPLVHPYRSSITGDSDTSSCTSYSPLSQEGSPLSQSESFLEGMYEFRQIPKSRTNSFQFQSVYSGTINPVLYHQPNTELDPIDEIIIGLNVPDSLSELNAEDVETMLQELVPPYQGPSHKMPSFIEMQSFNVETLTVSMQQTSPSPKVSPSHMISMSNRLTSETTTVNLDLQRNACFHVSRMTVDDLLSQDPDGDTILHIAIAKEEKYWVEALLGRYQREKLIADIISVPNKLSQTPLWLAVLTNQPDIVQSLIAFGSDVTSILSRRLSDGQRRFYTMLHVAASHGHTWHQTLKYLLDTNRVQKEAWNNEGRTPLQCAVFQHGERDTNEELIHSYDIIHCLVQSGCDLLKKDGLSGKNCLHYAIEKHDVQLTEFLLSTVENHYGIDGLRDFVNSSTFNENTALHLTVSGRMPVDDQKRVVCLLMAKGADVTKKNKDNNLPRDMTHHDEILSLLRGRSRNRRPVQHSVENNI